MMPPTESIDIHGTSYPITWVHTLVIGSGAAGLNAALQLWNSGLRDLLILTEGLDQGTSINTGSDKQTFYKLSLCGNEPDSAGLMAHDICAAGSMHGDLALVEASLSARAFLHLVNLGIPFPQNQYGQFIGYKTDHDPRRRATSIGPYTSREMCRALIARIRELAIPLREERHVVQILTLPQGEGVRAAGVIAAGRQGEIEVYAAENLVFAVGGPGGLYENSVYPECHHGGIGLALMAGAKAQNLPESQFGIASTQVRWCLSGSFMQSIPRFYSVAEDGRSAPREFLLDYFNDPARLYSLTFLKGYQWPFDARKAPGGSSMIDILVDIETTQKGRRVFIDYRQDPAGLALDELEAEALTFLQKSNALAGSPVDRLRTLNPGAYAFYLEHGIDLQQEPLEVRVCAQHNNGGLAANCWWESDNLRHFFPIGEVNGSHGVARPGGTALNAGQVGGFRAAEFIAHRYCDWTLDREGAAAAARRELEGLAGWLEKSRRSPRPAAARPWQDEWAELRRRMSASAAHIRSTDTCRAAAAAASAQWQRVREAGCAFSDPSGMWDALRTRHLCFAHWVYLEAILFQLESGAGSRGSSIVLEAGSSQRLAELPGEWRIEKENPQFRDKVLETAVTPAGGVNLEWVPKREIPAPKTWFETDWEKYKSGEIFSDARELNR